MATLQESVGLLGKVRAANPGLDALNDQELADLLFEQTGDEALLPAKQSSAIGRGINTVGTFFGDLGRDLEGAISPEGSSFPRKVVGRTVGNLVSSAPELAINTGAAMLRGLPRLAGYGAGAAFSYGRTKAETGDDKAALGSAAGSLASLYGGTKGAKIGRKLAGPAASKVGGFLAGTTGSALGSVPGDLLEVATSPGGLDEFMKDPVNLPAYALGQVGVGGALDLAGQVAQNRLARREANLAAIPELESMISKSEREELAALKAKPAHEKTEIELGRERELTKSANRADERLLRQKTAKLTPENFSTYPEAPQTIKAQVSLLNHGKKAVVEIPQGTDTNLDYLAYGPFREYTSPTNGNLYLFDETKASPELIENSIKTNSLGILLGYGTPSKPAVPTGKTAVLRSKRGTEKAAVILGDGNEDQVLKALGDMALGDDVVRIEPMDEVIKWREKNSGLINLFSLSGDMKDAQDEISFTNHVLDMFDKSLKGTQKGFRSKGPRFQVDQNAEIGGYGLMKAVKDWAPAELWAHYKEKGIETLLNSNKVKAADFTKWIRENTPEVEVKKLNPDSGLSPATQESAAAQHFLETRGYQLTNEDGSAILRDQSGNEVSRYDAPEDVWNAYTKFVEHGFDEKSDAATGKYGIEPKPLDQMPGAVDILVRVPRKEVPSEIYDTETTGREPYKVGTGTMLETPLFQGPHFGDSDKNVLASIRGYEETLPSGEKVFHVFEVQSDWGQKVSKSKQEVADEWKSYEGRPLRNILPPSSPIGKYLIQKGFNFEPHSLVTPDVVKTVQNFRAEQNNNHPLLASYETLALKTAIQHARSIGAKYIAISDAETAMMTEGHDRNAHYSEQAIKEFNNLKAAEQAAEKYRANGDFDYQIRETGDELWTVYRVEATKRPSQEPGMRAAYDQRLPAIAEKLTRSKGQRAEFGQHKAVGDYDKPGESETTDGVQYTGSPVFKDGAGIPKHTITARLYDISNPAPEVKNLFSLYDADKQASFEHTLRLEKQKRGDGVVTQRQVLEKALNGQYREIDPLLNFLDSIKGIRGVIREGTFLSPKQLGSLNLQTGDIKLNKDLTFKLDEAFGLLGHELTHGAIVDLKRSNPQAYDYLLSLVDEIGPQGRQAILKGLKEQLKLGDRFDTTYLSGQGDNFPLDPFYRERTAHEFVAGLAELSAHHFAQSSARPDWYKYLPQSVIMVLDKVMKTLKKYFGNEFPGVGHMLDASQDHRLRSIVGLMDKHVSEQVAANLRAVANLQKTSVFDEINFIDSLPTFRQTLGQQVQSLRGGEGELYSFAGDLVKKYVGKADDFYRNWFYNGLFRTRDKPETLAHFMNLHGHRTRLQNEFYGYLAQVGQQDEVPLSREQALARYGKFAADVADPTNKKGQRWLQIAGDILAENQNRREQITNRPVEQKDLVSRQEMQDKFKLNAEEAEFVEKMAKIPELVAKERLRKQEQIDSFKIARLFYRKNKAQNMDGVVEKVSRLNRVANDFGAKLFQLDSFKHRLEQENKSPEPNLELQGQLGADIQVLEQEKLIFQQLLDQAIRQEFAGAFPIQEGRDSFVQASVEALSLAAAQREHYRVMTQDIGYAPMTRRGRFHLKVYEPTELGKDYAKVKEYKGFQTKKEATDYVERNGIQDFELVDKEELKERMRLFTPDKIDHVRNKARQDFQDLIAKYGRSTEDMDPEQRAHLLDVLDELGKRFMPLEQEYKDVVSVKGDKFKERRYLVPGFDKNDFVPNIIEYADYNTVAMNKQWTRAKAEYLLEDGRLDSQPELRKRMEDEVQYTLSNQTEWNLAKKLTFYNYLGLSFRHVLQNALQMPINGISQMVADGYGMKSYGHFAKAAALAAQWSTKGTTGDAQLDALLKQAERDGVTIQQSIDNPVHDSTELQNAIDSINSQSAGNNTFGKKIKYEKTQAIKRLEKFLQSTSTAAESANRKTTFIASILAQRSKGGNDLRKLYDEAGKFVNYVNFTGDKANRPGFLIKAGAGNGYAHGPMVVASLLQSFVLNHVSQLYSFYKKGWGPQKSMSDKKAFATGVAHLFAFTGMMGLVGAGTAEAVIEELTGHSLKTLLREGLVELFDDNESADAASDFILGGFPALLGVDLSNSVGLGQPLIRYQAGQPITAEQLGGPAIGLLGRYAEAGSQIKADPFNPQQYWAAMRTAAPQFLNQFLRAADVLSTGTVVDKNEQPAGDALGIVGSAAALAGFTPTQIAKQRAFNSEVYKATKRSSDNYELRVRNVAKSLHAGDIEKAHDLFMGYLADVKGLQDRSAMVNSVARQLEEFEGKVTRPASLKDLPARQRLERAFPSIESQQPTELSSLLKTLEVALSLGQDDVLLQKLDSLPSGVLDAVLSDALNAAGLPPAVTGLIQQPSRAERLGPGLEVEQLLPR